MDHEIKSRLIEAYDRHAQDRDKGEVHNWKIKELDRFIALLEEEQKKTLLVIGAGTGKISKSFKNSGFEVVSTDLSSEMARLCHGKGVPACVMDFCDMAFPEESFDAVWALNCLLHVPKVELPQVLGGIRDVLKPNGLFYMGVYGGPESEFEGIWEDDYYTPNRFFSFCTDERIRGILADVFDILYFRPITIEQGHFQSMILRKKLAP